MPNMPLFTGVGMKCNKGDVINSQNRGAQREGDAQKETGVPADRRQRHDRRWWLDERHRRWWTGGDATTS
jgi:hypothetical protein